MVEPDAGEIQPGYRGWNNTQRAVVIGFAVVAVSAGAFALFFPFFMPLHTAYRNSDMSNMKQVNLSLIMYASDWDDLYPRAGHWMDDIYPYSKNEIILHSLAVLPASLPSGPTKTDPYGIAFRKSLASVNSAKIALPEQIAILFDSTDLSRSASGELDLLPDPPRHKNDVGRYNLVGFVDGHVKSVPKPVVIVR